MNRYNPEMIRKPARLRRGDTIGIVAPAWSFNPGRFRLGIAQLKRFGFHVKYERSIFKEYWSMAGRDSERGDQINRMFADREVKAIFCAKAGYGSIRTIPHLDSNIIRKNPKIFVGYSDITILLAYLQKTANMVVFHGPVVAGEIHKKMNRVTFEYLMRSLTQGVPAKEVDFPCIRVISPGKAVGRLIGGNMSMIVSGIGTPYDIDTNKKILFLEDIGEDLEVIDNILIHLRLAGKFDGVRGVIFGRMVDCSDNSGKKYKISDVINGILGDLNIPIIYGFPSGHAHGMGANITIPLGASVILDADRPSLKFNESGVR